MDEVQLCSILDKLLIRDGKIKSTDQINNVSVMLDLNARAEPLLIGFYELDGKACIEEYCYLNNKWISTEAPSSKIQEPIVEVVQDIPLEWKVWLKRLPDDPEKIPIGEQRERLKEFPIQLVQEKYPPEKFPILHEWLNLKQT